MFQCNGLNHWPLAIINNIGHFSQCEIIAWTSLQLDIVTGIIEIWPLSSSASSAACFQYSMNETFLISSRRIFLFFFVSVIQFQLIFMIVIGTM